MPELEQARSLAAAPEDRVAEPVAASPADPFARLVLALEDVAQAFGAGDDGIPSLRALFGQARLDKFAPGERAAEALLAGDVIAQGPRGFSRSSAFTGKVLAWQGNLAGQGERRLLVVGRQLARAPRRVGGRCPGPGPGKPGPRRRHPAGASPSRNRRLRARGRRSVIAARRRGVSRLFD